MAGKAEFMAGPLWRLAEAPVLWLAEQGVTSAELADLQALVDDEPGLEAAFGPLNRDSTGTSAELSTAQHPLLATVERRLHALLGLTNRVGGSLRMRRYGPGQGHPPHLDVYEIAGQQLLATAILCVHAPTVGGQTVFLDGGDGPLQVEHRPGQVVAWLNVRPNGEPMTTARHLGAQVLEGQKVILSLFFYGQPADLRGVAAGQGAPLQLRQQVRVVTAAQRRGSLRGFGRVLAIVDDGVPSETVQLLRNAAEERGVRVTIIDPRRYTFSPHEALREGDLLFRPATSLHSSRVEQHLWNPKLGTFYLDPDGPMFANLNATETFARAGLSIPRTYWLEKPTREMLRQMVDQLGGLPVVVKALGYSRGVGVIRADSLASLFSIVDFATAEGGKPLLTTYIPDAVHWRVVVVGDKAVASYRNVTDPDDFRTSGSDDLDDYLAPLPEGAAELAVRACQVLRHAHGGVDVLEHPSGRLYLLEANFPCYYAQAQMEAGIDVAGAMVEYLLAKAEELAAVSQEPVVRLG